MYRYHDYSYGFWQPSYFQGLFSSMRRNQERPYPQYTSYYNHQPGYRREQYHQERVQPQSHPAYQNVWPHTPLAARFFGFPVPDQGERKARKRKRRNEYKGHEAEQEPENTSEPKRHHRKDHHRSSRYDHDVEEQHGQPRRPKKSRKSSTKPRGRSPYLELWDVPQDSGHSRRQRSPADPDLDYRRGASSRYEYSHEYERRDRPKQHRKSNQQEPRWTWRDVFSRKHLFHRRLSPSPPATRLRRKCTRRTKPSAHNDSPDEFTYSHAEYDQPRTHLLEYNVNPDESSHFQREDSQPGTQQPEHDDIPDQPFYAEKEDGPSGTQSPDPSNDNPDDSFDSMGEPDEADNHSNSTKPTTPDHSPTREELSEKSRSILKRFAIPEVYIFRDWDKKSRPFTIFGSVFDAKSLGEWIYNWAFYYYRYEHVTMRRIVEFQKAFFQLDRNVAEAVDGGWPKRRRELRVYINDGIEILDDIDSLVRVCKLAMMAEKDMRRREEMERAAEEEGDGDKTGSKGKAPKVPFLKTDSPREFIDALLNSHGFRDLKRKAEAWNRAFERIRFFYDGVGGF